MASSSTMLQTISSTAPHVDRSTFLSCRNTHAAAVSKMRSAPFNVFSCTPSPVGLGAARAAQQQNPHATPALPEEASYISMRADPLGFWDTHKGLLHQACNAIDNGLLMEEHHDLEAQEVNLFLAAELRLLANAASDRAEMHSILTQQRDNWNKLFQRMLTAATMTACVLSSLDGQAHSLSLSLPALLLNAGSAAMMAIINQFQPSQLAEEQRTAARLFRKLASDIHYALHVAPHLRQDAPSLLRDCKRRLQALDKAFPMPVTPGGLEKFPTMVVPLVLREPLSSTSASSDDDNDHHHSIRSTSTGRMNQSAMVTNGWDEYLTRDLQHVAALLHRSDIPKYTGWAQNLVKVNKCLAIAAPLFAASAAVLNALAISTTMLPSILGMWAAVCSVLAAFAGSLSNDMQLGMVSELYRNSAGYYADVKASIEGTLGVPVQQRENGTLFRQRIAYQLGRWPATSTSTSMGTSSDSSLPSLVPPHCKEAGTLF